MNFIHLLMILFFYFLNGIEVNRTPKGVTRTISNRLILPVKTIPIIYLLYLTISLYQTRTDTNYLKGSRTTFILKDL